VRIADLLTGAKPVISPEVWCILYGMRREAPAIMWRVPTPPTIGGSPKRDVQCLGND
jgi:hypothetical protein